MQIREMCVSEELRGSTLKSFAICRVGRVQKSVRFCRFHSYSLISAGSVSLGFSFLRTVCGCAIREMCVRVRFARHLLSGLLEFVYCVHRKQRVLCVKKGCDSVDPLILLDQRQGRSAWASASCALCVGVHWRMSVSEELQARKARRKQSNRKGNETKREREKGRRKRRCSLLPVLLKTMPWYTCPTAAPPSVALRASYAATQ